MSIKIEVWGEYACFTRPELKVERYSYDVITPSAAIGILEAIFWHPGMYYKIDKIHVLNPIQFASIRRNEVTSKISGSKIKSAIQKGELGSLYLNTKDKIAQRSAMVLKNVHYVIEAHFDIGPEANQTDNAAKFQCMLKRRIQKGQCYHQPYFGTREFPVKFRLWAGEEITTAYEDQNMDLGVMLHHMEYSPRKLEDGTIVYDASPLFFRAMLKNGVLNLSESEVLR